MAGPKIDASEFTVLIKASIEFPTVQSGKRKYVGWLVGRLQSSGPYLYTVGVTS